MKSYIHTYIYIYNDVPKDPYSVREVHYASVVYICIHTYIDVMNTQTSPRILTTYILLYYAYVNISLLHYCISIILLH